MSETAPTSPDNFTNIPAPPSKQQRSKKPIPLLLGLVVVVSGLGYAIWRNQPQGTVDIFKPSGRIESIAF